MSDRFNGPSEIVIADMGLAITFAGVPIAQFWRDLMLWELFLNDYAGGSKYIVELGAFRGGMSLFLLMQCVQRGMGFCTIERERSEFVADRTPLGRSLGLLGCFIHGDYFKEPRVKEVVESIVSDPKNHPVILFCDGETKPLEYVHFGGLIPKGGFIVVHDFGEEYGPGIEFVRADADSVPTEEIMPELCDRLQGRTRFYRRV